MSERTVTVTMTESAARAALEACGGDPNGTTRGPYHPSRALTTALASLPPVMDEPTYPGAVVMTDNGLAVRTLKTGFPWNCCNADGAMDSWRWPGLCNPRPLTAEERAEHGIPATLPDLNNPGLVERVAAEIYDAYASNAGRGVWSRAARAALAEVAEAGEPA